MGSSRTDEQFLIQVLNSLIGDYKLQIGENLNLLSIDELKEDLNIRYEMLSSK
jgi:hypothetical protein